MPTDPDGNRHCLDSLRGEALALVRAVDEHPLLGGVVRGDASREEYLAFLRGTYHYVRWSGPLLAETAEGLRRSRGAHWLVDLMEAKTGEESRHDQWVLDDLRCLGVNVELLKASAAPRAVTAYVEQSRSLAEAGSPGYLGAAYMLELISAHRAGTAARNLLVRGAISDLRGATSFLEGHADADTGHVALLEDVLGRIANPDDQDDICLAARQMRRLYPRFFPTALPGFLAATPRAS
jgi:hypothetical protein